MTSNVEICNVALERVERKSITDLLEGSPAANACNRIFGPTREELLRLHDWNFARTRVKLAQSATAPIYEYDYAYALPADWIATRAVHDNDGGYGSVDYSIEGLYINSSAADIYLTYTKAVTDPAQMPADFRSLFSYRLSAQLAFTSTLRQEMDAKAQEYLNRAQGSDSREDGYRPRPAGSWIGRRWRGGSTVN